MKYVTKKSDKPPSSVERNEGLGFNSMPRVLVTGSCNNVAGTMGVTSSSKGLDFEYNAGLLLMVGTSELVAVVRPAARISEN